MIPYGRQDITQDDVDAVISALRSDFITQGPAIEGFEKALSGYCGVGHGIAVCNATAALHIAYEALDVGPGDLVWTVPNTFAATANAARFLGAEVDFVDIDLNTRNMSLPALELKFAAAVKTGRLPKLVTPVHFAGLSCDMKPIAELCRSYGAKVVEDASHAVGGAYRGHKVGSCDYSDVTVFSFHPVKIVTTGEGGMAMAADAGIAERMALLRTHGITRNPGWMRGESEGPWYYEMLDLGYNYRITDIQAALGTSQLKRLDHYVARRNAIADVYDAAFSDCGIGLPGRMDGAYSAFHLYTVHWPDGLGGHSRRSAFAAMRALGIGVNVHYIPVHRLPYYADLGFRAGQFPNAEAHYQQAISLPMFPTLTDDELSRVIKVVIALAEGRG